MRYFLFFQNTVTVERSSTAMQNFMTPKGQIAKMVRKMMH